MLLIFGFSIRFRTTDHLAFFCPKCGGDRNGLRRTARRWFTLFWVPLIPLNTLGEVVECTVCSTRFEPDVADQPTTASLSVILANAVRVLTAMIVRTGDRTDPALRAAAVTSVQTVDGTYDDAILGSDIEAVEPSMAEPYVAPLAVGLQVAGKERFVGDLVRVALAGHTLTPDQRRVIDVAGRGLDLTPAHITGIVASVAAERSPSPEPDAQTEPPADHG